MQDGYTNADTLCSNRRDTSSKHLSRKGLWIGIKIHTYLNTPPSAMNCQLQSAALQEDSVIAIQSFKAKHSRTFDNIREHSKLSDKLALRDML